MSADLVRARIDEGPVVPLMWLVVFLGFLLNLADGIDVVAMSVTAPSVAAAWGLERAALGPLFSAALFGMAIGAAGLAPLSDRLGRRLLLVAAMLLVGLSMLAVSWIESMASVTVFSILRFVSGLGIGVIFGSAPALASEFMPSRYRSLAVSLVVMGYPVGAVLAGPIANGLIPDYGWTAVFMAGGVLTLCIAVVTWALLPESPEFLASRAGNRPDREVVVNSLLARLDRDPISAVETNISRPSATPVAQILTAERRIRTLALWVIYFMGFLTMYFMLSWIPTLFVDSGYTRAQGIEALTGFNLGAVPGILVLAFLTTRLSLVPLLSLFFVSASAVLAYVGLAEPSGLDSLMVLMFVGGVFLHGGFTCLYALATKTYPSDIRAAGVGWAAGLGRTGAIVSPLLAAMLISMGWGMYSLFLVFALPLLAGGLLLWVFANDS
ncbi:sugar phosphate permease [gamma proteobacterium HIMB55]|nr:sugar phosphate permease [gamma proteobacterium HIMB55]